MILCDALVWANMNIRFFSSEQYCEEWACEDCATSWLDCQYCSKSYCSINCGHEYVLDCQGEGCKRANCFDTNGEFCIEDKDLGAECVKRCSAWEVGYGVAEKGCGTSFCTDCRVKECKKAGFNCSACLESVASLLDDAQRLRKRNMQGASQARV